MESTKDLKRLKLMIKTHYPPGSPLREIILAEPDIISNERTRELVPVLIKLERMS